MSAAHACELRQDLLANGFRLCAVGGKINAQLEREDLVGLEFPKQRANGLRISRDRCGTRAVDR
jgi:hypothetical protein